MYSSTSGHQQYLIQHHLRFTGFHRLGVHFTWFSAFCAVYSLPQLYFILWDDIRTALFVSRVE